MGSLAIEREERGGVEGVRGWGKIGAGDGTGAAMNDETWFGMHYCNLFASRMFSIRVLLVRGIGSSIALNKRRSPMHQIGPQVKPGASFPY